MQTYFVLPLCDVLVTSSMTGTFVSYGYFIVEGAPSKRAACDYVTDYVNAWCADRLYNPPGEMPVTQILSRVVGPGFDADQAFAQFVRDTVNIERHHLTIVRAGGPTPLEYSKLGGVYQ